MPKKEAARRIRALGKMAPPELSTALNDRDFVPLEIDSGDSQPYDTWARKAHKSPHKQLGTKHRPIPLRNVIYLLPLGEFDETIAPPLQLLRKWCAAYFFGLRVELLEVQRSQRLHP